MDTKVEEIEGVGGNNTRRRYTVANKRRMVEESLADGASVSVVARRHDVNANQLFRWRKLYREGLLEERANTAMVAVHVTDAPVRTAVAGRSPQGLRVGGEVEITLSAGHRVVIRGEAECEALRVALEVLSR